MTQVTAGSYSFLFWLLNVSENDYLSTQEELFSMEEVFDLIT